MDILSLIFYFIIIIPSSIIHEYAHGWMAERLGDPTARLAGRMTLNPLAHIDLQGTVILPLVLYFLTNGAFLFAYAKPVPYNPYNLRDQKWGPAWVGVAGPLANFVLAAGFAVVLRFMPPSAAIVPLLSEIVYINVLLMIFNLVPIPPLDGSKILYALLPDSFGRLRMFLDRYGFIILLFFVFFLFQLIQPLIMGLFRLLVGV